MTKRRKYSPEFKREAVALTKQPGVSCRRWLWKSVLIPICSAAGGVKPSHPQAKPSKVQVTQATKKWRGFNARMPDLKGTGFLREAATSFAKESS